MCGGGGDALADPNPTLLVAFVVISLGIRVPPNVPTANDGTRFYTPTISTQVHTPHPLTTPPGGERQHVGDVEGDSRQGDDGIERCLEGGEGRGGEEVWCGGRTSLLMIWGEGPM